MENGYGVIKMIINIYNVLGMIYNEYMPFQKGNKLGKKFEAKEKHWNYKRGFWYYKSGSGKATYKRIRINGRSIPEHRHVMEQYLGRKLKRSEIVHHIDGNGLNNDISNLEIMSISQHNVEHGDDRRKYRNGFTCKCGSNVFQAKDMCKKCYLQDYYRKTKSGNR